MEVASSRSLVVFRLASALASLIALLQIVLLVLTTTKIAKLIEVHGLVGYITLLCLLVATISSYVWFRKCRNMVPVLHAGSLTALMVLQIGLGEAKVTPVHVGMGILLVLGTAALAIRASRRPGGAA